MESWRYPDGKQDKDPRALVCWSWGKGKTAEVSAQRSSETSDWRANMCVPGVQTLSSGTASLPAWPPRPRAGGTALLTEHQEETV